MARMSGQIQIHSDEKNYAWPTRTATWPARTATRAVYRGATRAKTQFGLCHARTSCQELGRAGDRIRQPRGVEGRQVACGGGQLAPGPRAQGGGSCAVHAIHLTAVHEGRDGVGVLAGGGGPGARCHSRAGEGHGGPRSEAGVASGHGDGQGVSGVGVGEGDVVVQELQGGGEAKQDRLLERRRRTECTGAAAESHMSARSQRSTRAGGWGGGWASHTPGPTRKRRTSGPEHSPAPRRHTGRC